MPPKKKAKTNGVTLYDFLYVLTELSNLYEKQGDERRAKSFAAARENLEKCDETAVLETSEDYKNIKGVGKSTLELMSEFLESGKCARLEELRADEEGQVTLIRGDEPNGITRDDLRDLVLAGKNEDKHTDALKQLYKEEDAFLKQAKKDLRKALEVFPYNKITYTLEDGLGLLRGVDEKEKGQVVQWGKYKMYVTTVCHDHDEATVHIKCEDFDETLTCGRWHRDVGMCEDGECYDFVKNKYLQSLNPEGDLEDVLYEIFDPFDLKHVPE